MQPDSPNVELIRALAVSQPGAESERLASLAVRVSADQGWTSPRVLDMGCGSGYIAIRMALAGARAEGCDIDRRAVRLAVRNAAINGVQVTFFQSDLCSGVPRDSRYEMIVFNPPVEAGVHSSGWNVLKNLTRRCRPLIHLLRFLRVHRWVGSSQQRDLVLRLLTEAPHVLAPAGVVVALQPSPLLSREEIPPNYELIGPMDEAIIARYRS